MYWLIALKACDNGDKLYPTGFLLIHLTVFFFVIYTPANKVLDGIYYVHVMYVEITLSVCQFVCLSICLSVHSSVCPYVCLSICLSVHMSVCPFICLSICLSVYMSVCPYVCLSICMSVHMYVCPYVCLSICLSVHLSIHMSCKCNSSLTDYQ